ncbi:MAG: V-type ATP synthase subunit E [Thermoplasmata archaeon]
MGLEEIIARIDSETKTKVDAIIAQANEEANKIREEARERAKAIVEGYEKRAKDEAEVQRRQMISTATLEGRMTYEKALEEVERKYFDALISRIKDFRNRKEYIEFLKAKISEASKELGGEFVCHLRKEDAQRVRTENPELRIVEEEIDPIGGVVVTTEDGKLILDFTFSQLMREKRDELSSLVRQYIR